MTTCLETVQNTNSRSPVSLSHVSFVGATNKTLRESAKQQELLEDDELSALLPRSSPSSVQTTLRDTSSPGSSEFPSMLSGRSTFKGSREGSNNCYSLPEVTDCERSTSEGSLSPGVNDLPNSDIGLPQSHSTDVPLSREVHSTAYSSNSLTNHLITPQAAVLPILAKQYDPSQQSVYCSDSNQPAYSSPYTNSNMPLSFDSAMYRSHVIQQGHPISSYTQWPNKPMDCPHPPRSQPLVPSPSIPSPNNMRNPSDSTHWRSRYTYDNMMSTSQHHNYYRRPVWPLQSSNPMHLMSRGREYMHSTYPPSMPHSYPVNWYRMAQERSCDTYSQNDKPNLPTHHSFTSIESIDTQFINSFPTSVYPFTHTSEPSARKYIAYSKRQWELNQASSLNHRCESLRQSPKLHLPRSPSIAAATEKANGARPHSPLSTSNCTSVVSFHACDSIHSNGFLDPVERRLQSSTQPRPPKRRRISNKKLSPSCPVKTTSSMVHERHSELLNSLPHLHEPVISLPPNPYPPLPSPVCYQTREQLMKTANHSTSESPFDSISCSGKYSRFPLSLRSVNIPFSGDAGLHHYLVKSTSEHCGTIRVIQDNLLLSSIRKASARCNQPHTSPVPSSPLPETHRVSTLMDVVESKVEFGRTTPPLSLRHSPSNERTILATYSSHPSDQIWSSQSHGSEEIVSTDSLAFNAPIVCSHCLMQIMEPETSIKWTLSDGDYRLFFCSTVCSIVYHNSTMPSESRLTISGQCNCPSFSVAQLLGENLLTSTVLLRQANMRLNKQATKRSTLADSCNKRKHPDPLLALRSISDRRSAYNLAKLRWRRFGRMAQVNQRSSINKTTFSSSFSVDRIKLTSSELNSSTTASLRLPDGVKDTRVCILCKKNGDGADSISGRLIQYDIDTWLHLNCILWCYDTYETVSGSLVDVSRALKNASRSKCFQCQNPGAGLPCYETDCPKAYHLPCAYSIGCSFYGDRGMYCLQHSQDAKELTRLDSLSVKRRVFICRDEDSQVAKVILDVDQHTHRNEHNSVKLRVGGLILNNVGQLLPDQIASGRFHSSNFIYPVGYSSTRIYWSYRNVQKRCLYHCKIIDCMEGETSKAFSNVKFLVEVDEVGEPCEVFEHPTCDGVWQKILSGINRIRRSRSNYIRVVQNHLSGEFLFGLTEPHVIRAIESLPGTDRLNNYSFKFGRFQLIREMPLAINPTGSARSEPKLRTHIRRKPTSHSPTQPLLRNSGTSHRIPTPVRSQLGSPVYSPTYSFGGTSKLLQYKRLRTEWRSNVILARSRIQGLGLYAARDLGKFSFIIEYLGELIRNEVGNRRELLYERHNRGVYMFRVDDDSIVDATMCGGLARYINHSCDPNCNAEILNCDSGNHIVILANRDIEKGEELTYDYKFDVEEDRGDRIPCLCGAANCRKWMN